jgi:hypothetical protein
MLTEDIANYALVLLRLHGIQKRMVEFKKLTRNVFLTLQGYKRTPSAAATVQVSHALPAVRFSYQ